MKKTTISFLILLIFAAFIFWTGYTQRKIKPDSFGVLMTKTGGLKEKPLLPGEHNWNWEFLLPTNAQLKLFQIQPYSCTKTVSGQLPSGPLYTKMLNTTYEFDYSFDFSISMTLSPEAVINLIKLNQISTQDDLTSYFDAAAATVAQLTANYLLTKSEENPKFKPESMRKDELLRNIQVYKEFPDIELFALSLNNSKIPDYSLYNKLQDNYFLMQQNNQQDIKNDEETKLN